MPKRSPVLVLGESRELVIGGAADEALVRKCLGIQRVPEPIKVEPKVSQIYASTPLEFPSANSKPRKPRAGKTSKPEPRKAVAVFDLPTPVAARDRPEQDVRDQVLIVEAELSGEAALAVGELLYPIVQAASPVQPVSQLDAIGHAEARPADESGLIFAEPGSPAEASLESALLPYNKRLPNPRGFFLCLRCERWKNPVLFPSDEMLQGGIGPFCSSCDCNDKLSMANGLPLLKCGEAAPDAIEFDAQILLASQTEPLSLEPLPSKVIAYLKTTHDSAHRRNCEFYPDKHCDIDRGFLEYLWLRNLASCLYSDHANDTKGFWKASLERLNAHGWYCQRNVGFVLWLLNTSYLTKYCLRDVGSSMWSRYKFRLVVTLREQEVDLQQLANVIDEIRHPRPRVIVDLIQCPLCLRACDRSELLADLPSHSCAACRYEFVHTLIAEKRRMAARASLEFELSVDWVLDTLWAQLGRCVASRIPPILRRATDWQLDIRRLRPDQGFVPENCQLICSEFYGDFHRRIWDEATFAAVFLNRPIINEHPLP